MFRNTYQSGLFSILYSMGNAPLQLWSKNVRNGHIKRISDEHVQSLVLEIMGSDVSANCISCPIQPSEQLGIKLPIIVFTLKNLNKPFSLEIQVLDNKNVRRRFRMNTFQLNAKVKSYICTMPLRLDKDWNHIQIDLRNLTQKVYGTQYAETLKIHIHANCRLRRVYFADRTYTEDELPIEFKLFTPINSKEGIDGTNLLEEYSNSD